MEFVNLASHFVNTPSPWLPNRFRLVEFKIIDREYYLIKAELKEAVKGQRSNIRLLLERIGEESFFILAPERCERLTTEQYQNLYDRISSQETFNRASQRHNATLT